MTEAWYELAEKHYKYRTIVPKVYETGWKLPEAVSNKAGTVHLSADGRLTIDAFYRWDGASGPTVDTDTAMHASLPHDALYELMREEKLPQSYRIPSDLLLRRVMLARYKPQLKWWQWGSEQLRRWHEFRVRYWIEGLERFGGPSAAPEG